MFERFDNRARKCLFLARQEANRLGSGALEPEHVLLGILREGDNKALDLLSHFGVNQDELWQEIEGGKDGKGGASLDAEIKLSENAKMVVAYTAREASAMLDKTIRPEHLVVGLLRVEGCSAYQILLGQGIDISKVRKEIVAMARRKILVLVLALVLAFILALVLVREAMRPEASLRPAHSEQMPRTGSVLVDR